jgi:hypothetical protein
MYTELHVVALVWQLAVIHKRWSNGDVGDYHYSNVTGYTLSKFCGISRYHVYNIVKMAHARKLINITTRPHRDNVSKDCFTVTQRGLALVEDAVERGTYGQALQFVIDENARTHNRRMQKHQHLAETLFSEDVS